MIENLDRFRPVPFYFLTTSDPAEYSDEAIEKAMDEVKQAGFGGIVFFNKPPYGFTEEEYLSDYWFDISEKFILACKKRGLKFWVNDGFNYPPGDAAGRIARVAPELKQYRLRPNAGGKFIAEETDWGFPAFEEKRSSELFHKFVYEAYYERLGKYFGNGLDGFFSDADNRRINAHIMKQLNGERYYPWSINFQTLFMERYGYDITLKLKELFNESDPQICQDYWRMCGELYQQWFANNHRWCKAHNVEYTFHTSDTGPLTVDFSARSSAFSEGDPLTLLSHSDYPGTDHEIQVLDGGTHYDKRLFNPQVTLGGNEEKLVHPRFNDTFWDIRAKLAGSAAYLNNCAGAMCEMFAATNWGTNYNNLSRIAAWQIIQGITFIVPHAVHYRFTNWSKYFAPPEFIQGTMGAGVKLLNDRLAKYCQAAASGRYLADVAVIEPTPAVWEGKESENFFAVCDQLNRKALGYVIIPAARAGEFPVVIDPLSGGMPSLPAERAHFTGGELAYMPREIAGEKYLLAANIWSREMLSGTLSFNGRDYAVEIAPGEIAIVGGPFESYREPLKKTVVRKFTGKFPVKFAGENLISFEKALEFSATADLPLTLFLPDEAEASVMLDGEKVDGGKAVKVFDDSYTAFELKISAGTHQITLDKAAEFDTPALLSGAFDLDLQTFGDYAKLAKTTYHLRIYNPEKAVYTLSPRRSELSVECGWEKQGQLFYSGMTAYELGKVQCAGNEILELPGFTGTAELLVNGQSVGKAAFAPYRFALPAGENDLELRCWNSMGNRFERYAVPSGLTAEPVIMA